MSAVRAKARTRRRFFVRPLMVAVACVLGLSLKVSSARAASGEEKLIKVIRSDPAFKVRMQAIRVLTKKLEGKGRASDNALEALSGALRGDDNHLVRGIAAFSLGKVGDERVRTALEAGKQDSNAFVRAQAEQALGELNKRKPGGGTPRTTGGTPPLVVEVERVPGVEVPGDVYARLESVLKSDVTERVGSRFKVGSSGSGRGYVLRGTISERRIERGGSKTKVNLAVKITVLTWPDKNLRHVFSSRAAASSSSQSEQAIARLEQKVLDAAVRAAARDAVNEISR